MEHDEPLKLDAKAINDAVMRSTEDYCEARPGKLKHSISEYKAESNVRLALGEAVLVVLKDPNISHEFKKYLLDVADTGVQKSGIGRDKFEELKERLTKTTEVRK